MADELQAFRDAVLVRNVVARAVRAEEFSSPEALKEYLHEHPDADPSKHKVKKKEKETGLGDWADIKNKQYGREVYKREARGEEHEAFEFPTMDALKKYLHLHPKADPSNHTVKQKPEEKPEDFDLENQLKYDYHRAPHPPERYMAPSGQPPMTPQETADIAEKLKAKGMSDSEIAHMLLTAKWKK